MTENRRGDFPHILLPAGGRMEPYVYPASSRSKRGMIPARDRVEHAIVLIRQLDESKERLVETNAARTTHGLPEGMGICVEVRGDDGSYLHLDGLERAQSGTKLLSSRLEGTITVATVFVPDGGLAEFKKLLVRYRDENDFRGKPKNRTLVESISQIGKAALRSFWTDSAELFPHEGERATWEVWLQATDDAEGMFRFLSNQFQIAVSEKAIKFPERIVVTALATPAQLSQSLELLDCMAELRLAKVPADFFIDLYPRGQRDWMDDLVARTSHPPDDAHAVTILDTGINNGHPLLTNSVSAADLLTYNPDWGVADLDGHGTQMSGVALYGDLAKALATADSVILTHRLESVKILPPPGFPPTPEGLWGDVTTESVARAELNRPDRDRTFCQATTADSRDFGSPSSWSAKMDELASGLDDDVKRLFIQATGNIEATHWGPFPDNNDVHSIQDPAQAFNIVTVGAYTEKTNFDANAYPGWILSSQAGGLSPSSRTSVQWNDNRPFKPDIVMEGGNGLLPSTNADKPSTDHSLSSLTTSSQLAHKLLDTFGDTSAATAEAARFAAILSSEYPDYWPETIRALMIHSATWTPEMRRSVQQDKDYQKRLLRRFGYGVPDLAKAVSSAADLLTLVVQSELQPFVNVKSAVKSNEMELHGLPWPRDVLLGLENTPVKLRVSLSYFIEPNPSRRGDSRKFGYQSHGLRFEVRRPNESVDNFRARVSKAARDEGYLKTKGGDPGWQLGPQLRTKGSVHSDVWMGTAVDLALRDSIIVYPVGGWWKERKHLGRSEARCRYSLVVSIHAPGEDVDIYTPVANLVNVAVLV